MTTLQETPVGPAGVLEAPVRQVDRRRVVRSLRPDRSPAGAVTALVSSVVLCAAAAGTVALLVRAPAALASYAGFAAGAGGLSWSDPVVLGAGLVLVAAGSSLVVLAVVPGRTRLVPLETGDPLAVIGMTRAGLRRTLRDAALAVEGVSGARVRLGRRYVEVVVVPGADGVAGADGDGRLLRRVGAAVGDRLVALGAMCGDEVVVRLRGRAGR
ncbi:DUF6286 domain-containing protein [Planomonospora corallina]|uniref:DUF6286 domain-containing protein n=1 Tax=Planomonospora corallina TaxID=1806052 RepID=A0ABV8I010_9ACTN